MDQAAEQFLDGIANHYRASNFHHKITTTDFPLPQDRDLARTLYDRDIIVYSARFCHLTERGASLVMQRIPITNEGQQFMEGLRGIYQADPAWAFEPDEAERRAAMEMQARGYVLCERRGWSLTAAGKEWMRSAGPLQKVVY